MMINYTSKNHYKEIAGVNERLLKSKENYYTRKITALAQEMPLNVLSGTGELLNLAVKIICFRRKLYSP